MKALPIGIQTLKDIINGGYLYVDKTEAIFPLIDTGKYYFLSRPRRFGKSLLLSTLKEIFLGNQELFKRLYIHDKITWQKHPVIHIDFTSITYDKSIDIFEDSLSKSLDEIAEEYDVNLRKSALKDKFAELIKKLSEINTVVVLIDEYDKPIIDFMSKPDKAMENREVLRNFYSVLKSSDSHIRFAFLTGVSKFSKVSIFSGLNNLNDITLSPDFANILGITETELTTCFTEHLDAIAAMKKIHRDTLLTQLKFYYNGYSWNGITRVYNPTSLLYFFFNKKFSNYWFATGTPTFLVEQIKQSGIATTEFEQKEISELVIDTFDIGNINIYSLLFQTGYLTITDADYEADFPEYILDYPNFEVKTSLVTYLIEMYTDYRLDEVQPLISKLKKLLKKNEIKAFVRGLQSVFAKIPYTLHIKREAYYHSLFYMFLVMLGAHIDAETLTDEGRLDATLVLGDHLYVIEIKYDHSENNPAATLEKLCQKAIKQIKDKKYYRRFMDDTVKTISLLGIGILDKDLDCIIETL